MADPLRTPLYDAHRRLGARLIDFAGWEMPVQYKSILDEHRSVRSDVGMFDTSHMGQISVRGSNAAAFLDQLLPNDIAGLRIGEARYSPLCSDDGGIIDDLLVYRLGLDEFLVVVNASRRGPDLDWMHSHCPAGVQLSDLYQGRAMIAVQGPNAIAVVGRIANPRVGTLNHFEIASSEILGRPALVARTGYTGEDGVEIFLGEQDAAAAWDALAELGAVPCGLGARDTLRLEAALPLYGNEIDATTNPLEAGLAWTVQLTKPDFIGKHALVEVKQKGVSRRLVGFRMLDRGIARHGFIALVDGLPAGQVTSGSYCPTVDAAIGMAYLPVSSTAIGTEFSIAIRDRPCLAQVVKRPFYRRKTV